MKATTASGSANDDVLAASGILARPETRVLFAAGGVVALAAAPALLPTFDGDQLAAEPWVVHLHLFSAIGALAIGAGLMVGAKGRTLHRVLGWTWVALMAATAVSSLFIRQVNDGAFSFIHGLSAWTLLMLPLAVMAARRRQVVRHRRTMAGLYFGGVLTAGLIALIPGRLLWRVMFGG